MAIRHLGALYNRDEYDLLTNMTWCMIGDACLQEALRSKLMQVHWKLNNLAVIYDNNQITCDGGVDVTCSEDINGKIIACRWNVIDVLDGSLNVEAIIQQLAGALACQDQPSFINVRTIIVCGSVLAGQA